MSNISITTICNKRCPYCFAGDSRGVAGPDSFMSEDTYDKALDYLERSGIHHVRLLGGEPTLHPMFMKMVHTACERGFNVHLFSNGLMPEEVIDFLAEMDDSQLSVLLNTIHLLEDNVQGILRQQKTMERLGRKLMVGVNIYSCRQDLEYLLEYVNQFDLVRSIRIGIAHPLLSRNNTFLHSKFYHDVGLKIYEFFLRCQGDNVGIGLDCGFVPCMFSDNHSAEIESLFRDSGRCCNPNIDLMPDGSFISCYPLSNYAKISLSSTITAQDVVSGFNEILKPYKAVGIYPYCKTCEYFKRSLCNGGCIAATMNRFYNENPASSASLFRTGNEVLES